MYAKKAKSMKTIRQIESDRLENIKKTKKEMQEWGIYRYPTPTKKIKSISLLRKTIEKFFEEHPIDQGTKAQDIPTPAELALYLGYKSERSMYSEINNPNNPYPEYAAYIEQAVTLITNALNKRQMAIAEKANRWEGVDAAINRMNSVNESTMPKEDKGSIAIQINMNAREKTRALVNDSINALLGDIALCTTKDAGTAVFEDIKEEVSDES